MASKRAPIGLPLFSLLAVLGLSWLSPEASPEGLDLPIGGPVAVEKDPPPPVEEEESPQFYDEEIPAESDSVIYVVDRSSSMSLPACPFVGPDGEVVQDATRLDYVKAELRRSILSLPESFTFNIVVFSECVICWKPSRMRASTEMKQAAIAWLSAITPWGWTNTGGATSRALADHGNKAVLLLSDGAPNFLDCAQTYIGDFETHRRVIRESNTQQAVIHTFGIGLDSETRQFMLEVARENRGTFREID